MDDMKAADFEHLVAKYAAAKGMTADAVRGALLAYDRLKGAA